ncbi:tRNA pseudouridine(55) synthase TruB [Aquibacillus salsiterrae]|uniref:tRNA pseudouridine synthase B n=1 Tax=Aquibacillus salsiterrae TaxID=2950439 RepID=A0A9X3WBA4_9BACI|nr:tRNA pseudouridine(55) synthase TruB [Aquibacillus salsiterrae]MDC3416357.1 tRNA pseudouridine(55) synthase TruB [Aquibacillus salsiterrae]
MDGIIPLWKPKGYTSHDCVMKIRKLLRTKKVGHTGTLDPDVEGVLPICVGQATKIVPFLTDTAKTYIAELTLGTATDTEDSSGEIIEEKPVNNSLTIEEINVTLSGFLGVTKQVPPMYSAVKVNGKKLYEYARAGVTIERPVRSILIKEIELLEHIDKRRFRFLVVCSKGTYIRTLCVDIGRALGYPAHMSHLIRTQTGSISEQETVTFDEIEKMLDNKTAEKVFLPIQKGVEHLDALLVKDELIDKIYNGQKLPLPSNFNYTSPFRVQSNDTLLAIYEVNPKNSSEIKPVRVFQPESR